MDNNQTIQLIQSPIIKHSLEEMGKSVSERLDALNIEKQVATEETLGTLKALRAELNKESQNFEDQRKAIKSAVLDPYTEFETIYKTEIQEKYKEADKTLKEKINDFEMTLKVQKKENLIKYFVELCDTYSIDWLTFDKLGIEVNLSTTEKKYKVDIFGKIQKIADELSLISTQKYEAEILVEYKSSLNVAQAIQTITQRKQAEKAEEERLLQERTTKRTNQLRSMAFIYHDLSRTYNWASDENAMISHNDVENLSDEDWIKRYAILESKTKVKQEAPGRLEVLHAPVVSTVPNNPVQDTQQGVEELLKAKFTVTGTYSELKALSEFLKSNNYKYENLD